MADKNMNFILKIADLYIGINSFYDECFLKKTEQYMCSVQSEGKNITPDVSVTARLTDEAIDPPTGKKLTDKAAFNWYTAEGGGYEYCLFDAQNNAYTLKITFDSQCKNVNLTMVDVKSIFGMGDSCFLVNAMERVFEHILIFNGGFAVHASSVVYNNSGLAFSALSGTGKSTHTGLWLKNYPGTVILNDDKPALRCYDGKWFIYGTPWAGTTGINTNMRVPLKALVFLERGEQNTIRDCVGAEAVARFMEAVVCPASDEKMDMLLESLNSLSKNSRLCVLQCNMTDEAPETVRKYLYG